MWSDFTRSEERRRTYDPRLVRERIGELQGLFPSAEFIAHFHDTRGSGITNTLAALELGLRYVDSSIGAIGGQPATGASKYSAGHTPSTRPSCMPLNPSSRHSRFLGAGKSFSAINVEKLC